MVTIFDPFTIRLEQEIVRPRMASPVASICCALLKSDHNDLVCEKACELGVESIIFWQAEHSVVQIKDGAEAKKLDRWKRIAESAAKQSKKTEIPPVELATSLEKLVTLIDRRSLPGDLRLCCSLSPEAKPMSQVLTAGGRVHLVVGPEGDFSPKEEEALCKQGFLRVALGPHVLRSETAAIAAVAMVQAIAGWKN